MTLDQVKSELTRILTSAKRLAEVERVPIKVSIAGSRFSKNWQPEKCCKMRKQKEAAGTVGTEVRRHRQGVSTLWQ